jgi:uncharacterized protein YceK
VSQYVYLYLIGYGINYGDGMRLVLVALAISVCYNNCGSDILYTASAKACTVVSTAGAEYTDKPAGERGF